jgi:hypothetical protein
MTPSDGRHLAQARVAGLQFHALLLHVSRVLCKLAIAFAQRRNLLRDMA